MLFYIIIIDRQAYLFFTSTVHCFGQFVGWLFGLLDFRTVEPSDYLAVGLSNCRAVGLSDCRTIGPSDYRTIGPSDYWAFGLSGLRTIGPSYYRDDTVYMAIPFKIRLYSDTQIFGFIGMYKLMSM